MGAQNQLFMEMLPVLDVHECTFWTRKVLEHQPQWTRRDPNLPFYTLGMAAYLDAVKMDVRLGGKVPYKIDVLRLQNNQFLNRHFAPLFDRCCQALALKTGKTVHCLGESAALPGFHIHLPHPLFAQAVASRHVDLQFQQVFGLHQPDPKDVLTLTLPLSLPTGAGLKLWSDPLEVFEPYQLGHLAIHNGLLPHQAVLHPQSQDVPRIMLQCHGLLRDGVWGLYW